MLSDLVYPEGNYTRHCTRWQQCDVVGPVRYDFPKVRFRFRLLDDLTGHTEMDAGARDEDHAVRQENLVLRLVGPRTAAGRLAGDGQFLVAGHRLSELDRQATGHGSYVLRAWACSYRLVHDGGNSPTGEGEAGDNHSSVPLTTPPRRGNPIAHNKNHFDQIVAYGNSC